MHPQYTKKERKYKPMSDTILALLGFATVIAVIVLLLRNVTVPALAFVSVSTITAAILVATGAFTLDEMAGFIKEGVKGVHGTAVLFIFSVLFFGVMTDAGMFDKIIGALMKKVSNNVVGVALMTCLIAIIGHLDGGGASTFLITIPAMLPVYKRLHMRRETLLLICVTAMGVMNLMPWGGLSAPPSSGACRRRSASQSSAMPSLLRTPASTTTPTTARRMRLWLVPRTSSSTSS